MSLKSVLQFIKKEDTVSHRFMMDSNKFLVFMSVAVFMMMLWGLLCTFTQLYFSCTSPVC